MKKRKLIELTNEEIREIINYLFDTKQIENISRNSKYDQIMCDVTTDWEDEDSPSGVFWIKEAILLKNPFEQSDPIDADFTISSENIIDYMRYCYAKGVVARFWVENNKWLEVAQ